MSAKLESTCHESPKNGNYHSKHAKVIIDAPIVQSCSPQQDETERICHRREYINRNLKDICMKETDRYYIRSYGTSPVVLTESDSSQGDPTERRREWNFQQQNCEPSDSLGIEEILRQHGLLQLFNCFEGLRSDMIQALECENPSSYINRHKMTIMQDIASLKTMIVGMHSSESHISHDDQEIKSILHTICSLRVENAKLKAKIEQLTHQVNANRQEHFYQNSIINNSISIANSSNLTSSEGAEQSSLFFNLGLDKYIREEIYPTKYDIKCSISSFGNSLKKSYQNCWKESNQEKLLSQFSIDRSRIISEQSILEIKEKQKEVNVLCLEERERWNKLLREAIILLKHLFKNQFTATNLALLKSNHLPELKIIQKSYKSFTLKILQNSAKQLFNESEKFLQFIANHSNNLDVLIKKQLQRTKKASSSKVPPSSKEIQL